MLPKMKLFLFPSRVRHPFFPDLAATRAAKARGRLTAVAGTFGELARAAAAGARPRRAVYLLTEADEFPGEGEREELWRLFQVPVFALLRDRGGRIVAWECEAQHGLHVDAGSGFQLGMREEDDCACGRPGARLMLGIALAADAAD
jgi:hypothetical protein